MKETAAMQIGRDDYKAFGGQVYYPHPHCPFPKGSADAAEWLEGWNREEMRNPQSKMSEFQKVRKIMSGKEEAG